jgi:dTDP-4-dehydrorhamnose reductase
LASKKLTALRHAFDDYVFDGSKTDFYRSAIRRIRCGVYAESKLVGEFKAPKRLRPFNRRSFGWIYGAGGTNF